MRKPETFEVQTWNPFGTYTVTLRHVPATNDFQAPKGEYIVTLGAVDIGKVYQREFTREHRTPGRMYVNRRWSSLGWTYSNDLRGHQGRFETDTRKRAVETLLSNYLRKAHEDTVASGVLWAPS